MSNYSRQKSTILKVVADHPHSDIKTITAAATKVIPNISPATVYRNLDKLEHEQKIQRVQINRNQVLYEPFKGSHHHFICTQCQTVNDLNNPQVEICTNCLDQKHSFTISHINMNIFGVCRNCQ